MSRSIQRRVWRTIGTALLAGAIVLMLSGCVRAVSRLAHLIPWSATNSTGTPDLQAPGIKVTPSVPASMPIAGKVEPPPSGAYLGVYVPPAPFDIAALRSFETTAGKTVSIVMWYQPWAVKNRSQFDAAVCLQVLRRGKVPMITWEPWDPGTNANFVPNPGIQPDFSLAQINAGRYDAYIRSWADQIRQFGGPIMLRPMHEMNGNWYPWSGNTNGNTPQEYVAAWRRIHDIFQGEGATNVTWVWSINHHGVPNNSFNSYAAYYPGDAYVDWTAVSGFNWGTSVPRTAWHTFGFWYNDPLAYLSTLNKPICLGEFSSVEQGGDKAAWILDAYSQIGRTPPIKAVIYFDSREQGPAYTQDWRIDTSASSLAAFKQAVSSDYFVGGPPATLTTWADSLSSDDWRYLSSLQPIY